MKFFAYILFFCAVIFASLKEDHLYVVKTAFAQTIEKTDKNFSTALKKARIAGDTKKTRLIFTMDKKVSFHAFTLSNPYRLVIDLANITFTEKLEKITKPRGLIEAFRYGSLAPGKGRIVLDLKHSALISKAAYAPSEQGQPERFVLNLEAVTESDFTHTSLKKKYDAPEKKTTHTLAPAQDLTAKTIIVLDPGHGGIDSGAIGFDGTKEKDVVLAFAKSIKKEINKSEHFAALLTRQNDIFIPLKKRISIAREKQAALFISIHADSIRHHEDVRGATLYTLSDKASDQMSANLAARENRVDILAGIALDLDENKEVADILLDLTRRETQNFSIRFANNMVNNLSNVTKMVRNPHRQANFVVLKAPDIPSVLLELGFLSNADDEALLNQPEWREKVAKSTARAIQHFFEENPPPSQ